MSSIENNIAYIDGANLHKGMQELGWLLDYRKFRVWLYEKYAVTQAKIFIGKIPYFKDIYENLQTAGFDLSFKKVRRDRSGNFKGNCDAELVVSAMSDYYENRSQKALIISSDGDFSCLARFLRDKNVLLSIISPRNSCSFLLRTLNIPISYLDVQRNHLERT